MQLQLFPEWLRFNQRSSFGSLISLRAGDFKERKAEKAHVGVLRCPKHRGEIEMSPHRIVAIVFLAVFVAALSTSVPAMAQSFDAELDGFQEVPAISTTGMGNFHAEVQEEQITYELSYEGLEGQVRQAHIHIGQEGVNGGIVAFLCTNQANAPDPETPNCPSSGTVTGTIDASDIVAVEPQGIAAGEFEEVMRAMESGATYVNVHSDLFPGGEIRGEVEAAEEMNEEGEVRTP